MGDIRSSIRGRVRRLVGSGEGAIDMTRPPCDDGLFGPGSAAWAVHGDVTAMMAGGIAALLLQMLHPGALAGVWDHSRFRTDMSGRLKRTAQFIGGTTYAATATAEALIARVRAIHDRVSGTLPDGTAYSANDPVLLTWVHVAEVSSFLAAHLRYKDPGFAEADRYYAEVATIAERLGAVDVPTSQADVAAYLAAMRPALRYDHRTRDVAATLLEQRHGGAAQALLFDGAIDLLPDWAVGMHGLERPGLQRGLTRAGMAGMGGVLRWAMRGG